MNNKILWLMPKGGHGAAGKTMISGYLRKNEIPLANVVFMDLHKRIGETEVRQTKSKVYFNPKLRAVFAEELDKLIALLKPSVIVCIDPITLQFFTNSYAGAMMLYRGSIYMYKDSPVLVMDKLSSRATTVTGGWIFSADFQKLARWWRGKQRAEPKFRYQVCRSLDMVRRLRDLAIKTPYLANDLETMQMFIGCSGYTVLNEGKLESYIVPFFNPFSESGSFWSEDDEVEVWNLIREINGSDSVKILQNGGYDSAYWLRYRAPLRNYLFDTSHMLHAIWAEAQKKLNFIASIASDHVRYWKDENKSVKQTDEKFKTWADLERWWRYCALDCHNTFVAGKFLATILNAPGLEWARENYKKAFKDAVGPALYMSMHGVKVSSLRHKAKTKQWQNIRQTELKKLRVMVDEDKFNPESDAQVAQLLYDILGARPIKTRGKRTYGVKTVDEKVLRLIAQQHPLFRWYIEQIWRTKKAANSISKYSVPHIGEKDKWVGLRLLNGRWYYAYNASGTKLGRYSSSEHQFWIGTQAQNIPKHVRDMMVVDEEMVGFEADYEQSDAVHVAFACEDPAYIKTMMESPDSHATHCEFFFNISAQKVIDGHAKEEAWVDDPITGVRQCTKKLVHGGNFQMQGFTLYMSMTHESAVASAEYLGLTINGRPPIAWTMDELVNFCQMIGNKYSKVLYKGLGQWFDKAPLECEKNGNRATCAGGLTVLFLGSMRDSNTQRLLYALYGQGGTAMNIRRTLNTVFWDTDLLQQGLELMLQTHDSIAGQVPPGKEYLIKKLLTIMEEPCSMHGREYVVRASAKIGLNFGKMKKFKDSVDIEELIAAEAILDKKYEAVFV